MSTRLLMLVTVGVITVLLLCGGGVAAMLGGDSTAISCLTPTGSSTAPAASRTSVSGAASSLAGSPAVAGSPAAIALSSPSPAGTGRVTAGPDGGYPRIGRWSPEQVGNAATIIAVGARQGIPVRGQIVAVATAMQESSLINIAGGDRDSIGLFQQRPSQGWGTPAQVHDPVYASTAFYQRLQRVPGWQNMPVTEAAQAVQRSALPRAYARWEADATTLVTTLGAGVPQTLTVAVGLCADPCPQINTGAASPATSGAVPPGQPRSAASTNPPSASTPGTAAPSAYASGIPGCEVTVGAQGWVAPVKAGVVSEFRSRERPSHNGVDLGAARGTPIVAAADGTVSRVRCDVPKGRSCDVDGFPGLGGCGWYVDITHPGGVISRYCHMLTRPGVTVGQRVVAGQRIGVVGSSGNSSGPHLHFEIHLRNDPGHDGAVEPVAFLRSRGVALS